MNAGKDSFDKKIKELSGYEESCFGYKTYKEYPLYFKNDIFKCFVNEMKQKYHDAFQNYNDGKGGELKHGNSRYGMIPPKMSSVASSSRFIYLTFRK